ncbi:hypothetical protein PLICRDRAFT_107951 [Plicaturopsis crispa FD-325 SS-3]|nr:hypothetical protein PLICRDRAFT_107951 [Plicaturopsis crispa FD-325 SS-3]
MATRGTLTDVLIARGVDEMIRLEELRQMGRKSTDLDHHFANQRNKADNASEKMNRIWFRQMRVCFQEIDRFTMVMAYRKPLLFLDLGCSPGGFSSYILAQNALAKGVGVSLDVEKGGHVCLLEQNERFEHLSADLTYYQLGPAHIPAPTLQTAPSDIQLRTFDLAVLDGHQLRTQVSANEWDRDRLLISQVILGLRAVKSGGTIVVKLSHPEMVQTAKLLYAFDKLGHLRLHKPSTIHTNRGTFYAVVKSLAKGQNAQAIRACVLEGLEKLWVELTFGGDGHGRFLTDDDLDFILTTQDLEDTFIQRLVELGRGVWTTQADALEAWFVRKGIYCAP